MVLDDASPQANNDSSAYNIPSSSATVNSASQLARYHSFQIKPELIANPDPFTLYFGFFGRWNWNRKVAANIVRRIENARVLVQRLPTQDEVDAFVQHSSRSLYQERIGAPIAATAGVARLYTQMKKSERFTAFAPPAAGGGMPSPRQLWEAALSFSKADPVAFRQTAFGSLFKLLFWTVGGATLTSIWAVYNDTKNTMSDPRLTQFVKEVRQTSPEEVHRRKIKAVSERHRQHQQQQQQEPQGLPSSSPVSQEQDAYAESNQHDQDGGYGSLYSDKGSTPQPEYKPQIVDENKGSDFFDDDDASPTAPEYRVNRPGSNSPQGSAWERIRQQNASRGTSAQGGQPSQWGSWNNQGSSNAESSRQREREQAKADFDRLVEAERNVSDDSSGNGGRNQGWGKWN